MSVCSGAFDAVATTSFLIFTVSLAMVLICELESSANVASFSFDTLDIAETQNTGVHMIIFADDLLIYVIDPNEDHVHRKMLDTMARIRA